MIEICGARGISIKDPSGLDGVDGLVIPGGESTTIGGLISDYEFNGALCRLVSLRVPVFGTCAGMIVLAREVDGAHGPVLGLMDIVVRRNAFGRQVDSFQRDLTIKGIDDEEVPFEGVFIRAPVIEAVGEAVEIMAGVEEGAVMAREGGILACAFHPELTDDTRVHEYFIEMVLESTGSN